MARKNSATRRILKIIIGLIIVLVLLGIVGAVTGMWGGDEEVAAVETAQAHERDITQVVTAFGRVQPEVEVTISPDVSGEIVVLPVEEGDRVEEGDLLASIEPDFYVAQVEQAEAGVSQAKANRALREADLLQAESVFERQQTLYERDVISESDFEAAQNQFKAAQANHEAARYQVESAEAQLREARDQLTKTRIYAPMSGTVSMLSVELGERVVGTSQMAGTEMMRIAQLGQMEVEVDVNENDVVNVALGDTASIDVDAYPDRPFKGVVTEIANSARVSGEGTQEQVTNFPVKVRILEGYEAGTSSGGSGGLAQETPPLAGRSPVFRPGMSGTVDIFTQTVEDAVAVPIQAVTVRDFNRVAPVAPPGDSARAVEDEEAAPSEAAPRGEDLRKVVFLVGAEGKAEMVEVETGISDDTHVQIRTGLDGGEEVIIGPYQTVSQTLRPGVDVRVEEQRPIGRRSMAAVQ